MALISDIDIELDRVPLTLVGADALPTLLSAVEELGGTDIVIIADSGVRATGYVDRVVDALRPRPCTVHVVPPGEPTVDSVDAAATLVRDARDAIVIGVGGGSALDIAKQAAVVSAGQTGIEPYLLCAAPLPGRRPIVAIPTTSGTGAEVTRTCIVSDRSGRKLWTWGDEMLPDVVVLDPVAAASMPQAVTIGTGLDAFVHAIEASSGQRRATIASAPAQRAMELVVAHLPRVVADGSDLASRQAMQEAAFLAGIAIDNCGTGVAHSIGHALGTLCHMPHGVAVALGLLATLDWNAEGAPDAYADAAAALGCSVDDVASDFAALCNRVGLAEVVSKLGAPIDPDEIAGAMTAIENQPMLGNNARAIGDDDPAALARRTVGLWHVFRP